MEDSRGAIVSLQICPGHRAPMQFKNAMHAIEGFGLEGDRHAYANGTRQVLFMDEETLTRLGLPPGIVKENITTRGIELKTLAEGTHLRVGDVEFEITHRCDPCERMDEIREGLRGELQGQRGMLARVLSGGEIRVGDAIEVVRQPEFAK